MKQLKILLFLFSLSLMSCQKQKFDIIVTNANIIDVETGEIIENQDIGITNQIITQITKGHSLSGDTDTKVIDADGKYVITGLWDMHVHLYFPDKAYLKMYLSKGVTGIREMSGWHSDWEDTTNNNPNIPRMMISSSIMDGPIPWFKGDIPIKNSTEAARMVREAKNNKFDFIKILSLVPEKQYKAIAKECKKLQYDLAGHIPYSIHPIEAAKAGQKSNEHMKSILLACSSEEEEIRTKIDKLMIKLGNENIPSKKIKMDIMKTMRKAAKSFSQNKADILISELSRYEMWQCPTLGVLNYHVFNKPEISETDNRDKYFPYPPKKMPKFDSIIPKPLQKARARVKLQMALLNKMHKKGIKILAGSDQGCAGFNLHDELAYLVEAGLTESEALKTATINPAIYMHKDQYLGSIKVNKTADLVILNSNPLESIHNTRDIQHVIFKNEILNPKQLARQVETANNEIITAMSNSK